MSLDVRRAIYGKLAGDSTLDGLLGDEAPGYAHSIYYERAPAGASFPYVIFQVQASTPDYSYGAVAYENDVWLIKGVAQEAVKGTDTVAAADQAEAIQARLRALLQDAALSISGKTKLYLRREQAVDYPETRDSVRYRHSGDLFRLMYA